jgi:hypothetical protein
VINKVFKHFSVNLWKQVDTHKFYFLSIMLLAPVPPYSVCHANVENKHVSLLASNNKNNPRLAIIYLLSICQVNVSRLINIYPLSLVTSDTPNAKRKRPPNTMGALCLWIM